MKHTTQGFSAVALVVAFAIIIAGGIIYYNTAGKPASEESPMMHDEDAGMMGEDGDLMMGEGDAMEGEDMMAEESENMMEGGEMMEGETMDSSDGMMNEDDMMEGESMSYSGSVIAGTSAPLLDFTQADYQEAIASDKLVVLYFYANWCPICAEETKNALYPAFNELTGSDVIGFRVNYNDNQTNDNERDLAREFGVAYQHTKVFVKNGKRVLKSPESWDKERYMSEIAKAL